MRAFLSKADNALAFTLYPKKIPMENTIFLASDHAGFNLKSHLLDYLQKKSRHVLDLGPAAAISCHYPESAQLLTNKVLATPNSCGILICGTGIGMSMAANRVHGIRAALATHETHARLCRAHNNANVLCLGERITAPALAETLLNLFLETPFEEGRHALRVDMFN